jgi:hypothetical protein
MRQRGLGWPPINCAEAFGSHGMGVSDLSMFERATFFLAFSIPGKHAIQTALIKFPNGWAARQDRRSAAVFVGRVCLFSASATAKEKTQQVRFQFAGGTERSIFLLLMPKTPCHSQSRYTVPGWQSHDRCVAEHYIEGSTLLSLLAIPSITRAGAPPTDSASAPLVGSRRARDRRHDLPPTRPNRPSGSPR